MAYITVGMMWVATSAAVIVGIKTTGDIRCLWAFLIPAMIRIAHYDSN